LDQGTWSGTQTSYTYQWNRGGVNISSATNNTYILVEADDGTDITCSVTAINSAGSASAASNIIEVRHMTTADGKQVWWVVGDSLTTKRNPTGTAYGPTPTAGTVYQCDDSTSYAVNQILHNLEQVLTGVLCGPRQE
jgi:hypothetical protein